MRNESKKAAYSRREFALSRNAYRDEFPRCQICHFRSTTDVHEIARGPARQLALGIREAWLGVCRCCHDDLDDYSVWPIERQLAIKLLEDPAWFNPALVNELRGRAPTAITLVDIVPYLRRR